MYIRTECGIIYNEDTHSAVERKQGCYGQYNVDLPIKSQGKTLIDVLEDKDLVNTVHQERYRTFATRFKVDQSIYECETKAT